MDKVKWGIKSVALVILSGLIVNGCVKTSVATGEVAAKKSETDVAQVKAADYSKPGFYTEVDKKDGRLWVFAEGSADLKSFKEKGKPAKQVLRPGVGPGGMTLKSTESETIQAYLVAKPGFYTEVDKKDGRLWVFAEGSEDLKSFKEKGKPAKQVLRPGAGPGGMTLKSTEASTLDAYQNCQ